MNLRVDIEEAKTQLSGLVERAAQGEHIVICKAGRPVADLVPHRSVPVAFGGLKGELAYDDADIDPEIQRMFYGPDAAS